MSNKNRFLLVGILIIGIISMTIAFAALSTNLSINGTASVAATSWNIHFANGVDNTQSTHASGKVNKGTITGLQFAATSISNFTATLYQPNDEVVYNFDIVNDGTIDGQLDNFTKTITCNSASCDMITYTITCEDAQHNDANQSDYILASGKGVSCEMKIKYNDQTNSGNSTYTQTEVSATVTATWLYKQLEDSSGQSGNSGSGSGGNSGSNEQGQGGENTEPEENWDNYVSPNQPSGGASIPSGETIWLQTNSTSNIMEVCAVFPNGTLCFNETDFNVDQNGRAISGDKTSAFTQKVTDLGGTVFYLNGDANISGGDKICTYSLSTYGCSNNNYTYSCFNNYGNITCKDER